MTAETDDTHFTFKFMINIMFDVLSFRLLGLSDDVAK